MSNEHGYKLEDDFWSNQYRSLRLEKEQDDKTHADAIERLQARCNALVEELNQVQIDYSFKIHQVAREAFLEGHASASCGSPLGWEQSVARQISEGYKRA